MPTPATLKRPTPSEMEKHAYNPEIPNPYDKQLLSLKPPETIYSKTVASLSDHGVTVPASVINVPNPVVAQLAAPTATVPMPLSNGTAPASSSSSSTPAPTLEGRTLSGVDYATILNVGKANGL